MTLLAAAVSHSPPLPVPGTHKSISVTFFALAAGRCGDGLLGVERAGRLFGDEATMPDMDTPQALGPLTAAQPSKRPREDGSPVCGKRGKKKTAAFPVPALGDGNDDCAAVSMSLPSNPVSQVLEYNPVASPPLCESPSKINQAPTPTSFAPFSGGEAAAAKPSPVGDVPAVAAAAAATRRKGRVPYAAPPSLGATDPVFHAALLRLLHGRNGKHCPQAVGWRWRGDSPARFDHWPCALHPVVMDLLACVSAGEERVVMTGCDKQKAGVVSGCCGIDDTTPPPREAAWRAPRPRTPLAHRGGLTAATAAAAVSTPTAAQPPYSASAQTPSSALRRPGSSRRLSNKTRVRFSTHDMSVVDTPDPHRGGSEEGMISALSGLESILSAAERVRDLACRGSRPAASRQESSQQYEGYFDRFSAAGGQRDAGVEAEDEQEDEEEDGEEAAASEPAAQAGSPASPDVGQAPGTGEGAVAPAATNGEPDEHEHEGSAEGATVAEKEGDVDACLTTDEAKSVREDSAAFVAVLEKIAASDSAPEEVALAGGWGPEHSNAAAFYAKELALLCGANIGDQENVAPLSAGVGAGVGSHLRGRYLDVLSCLVRYNLKVRAFLPSSLRCVCVASVGLEFDCQQGSGRGRSFLNR